MEKEKSGMKSLRKWMYERKEKKTKGFKSIVALSLCFLLFLGNVGLASAQSQSTEKADFTISSVKDFNSFITRITNGDDYTGKIVKVTADVDFTGAEFTQIPSFGGTFDGGGHILSGIAGKSGLFNEIKSTGTVKNFTIKDSSFVTKSNVGAIAYDNYGIIENCSNYASIKVSWDNAGGIVYNNHGTIINCVNYGDILKEGRNGNNDGNGIGGIAYCNYSTAKIINCSNQGNLVSTYGGIGGIVCVSGGQVANCFNTGTAQYGICSSGTSSSCYFLDTASDTAMPGTYTDNNALAMKQSEMSSDAFIIKLNKGASNSEGTLKWEVGALYPQFVSTYEVTFEKNYNYGVVSSNYSYAAEGTKVTLTAKPSNKYYTKSLTVSTKDGMSVDVNAKGNIFTFSMPNDNVVVSATFSTVAVPKSVKYSKSNKTISWGKVTDATGYEIYRSTSKTANFKLLKSVTTLKYTDSKTTSSTKYYYKVRAYILVDGNKVYGSLSSIVGSK